MDNPFTESSMIRNPAKFFGRKEELHHIENRLRNMESISVVGERRIGKSSLLYHLYQTGTEKLGECYRLTYVDLQDVRNHFNCGKLFENILKQAGVSFVAEDTVQGNLIAFSEATEKLHREGTRLAILFDEFEEIVQHREAFPDDFFKQMRVLAQEEVLSIVTSSQRPLRDLCLDGQLTSPFYNVFKRIDLQDFTEEEAAEFLSHDWGIDWLSEEEVTFAISYPQYCHPLILQIICYWLVENRTKQLSEKDLEKAIAQDAENYFAKGFFKQMRRHKSDILKGGKELWEIAKAIITKRLGG